VGEIDGGDELEEGLVFMGAGGTEAGGDLVESGVGVAGMADEFPDGWARRHRREEGTEGSVNGVGTGDPGGENTDGAGGSGEAGVADEALEGSMLGLEGHDSEAAQAAGCGSSAEGPGGLEGIADGGDLAGLGGAEERAEDAGEEVSVLVGVDVGDVEASVLEAADLRGGFGGDFLGADAEGEEVADEGGQGGPEGLAVGAEGRDLAGRECGRSIDEEDVAAGFEGWRGFCEGDGVVEGGSGGHEGGGGESAGAGELDDRTIDPWGEAEVVGIDEEHAKTGYRQQGTGNREQMRRRAQALRK
jgi:hypothetical protein